MSDNKLHFDFLFDLDISFQKTLDKKNIDESLYKKFASHQHHLDPETTIIKNSTWVKGESWLILDNKTNEQGYPIRFLIVKNDEKLEVYFLKILLQLENISKNYIRNTQKWWKKIIRIPPQKEDIEVVSIFENYSLEIYQREKVAIVAPSGVGKTTLLNIAGLLDKPNEDKKGEITLYIEEKKNELRRIKYSSVFQQKKANTIRRDYFGFIFQMSHMIKSLRASENLALPLLLQGKATKKRKSQSQSMIEDLFRIETAPSKSKKTKNENHIKNSYTNKLSGGQLQRISIGRALIHSPKVVFADEPTGSLDKDTSKVVLDILFKQVETTGSTLVLVTHDLNLAERCDRIIRL